MDGCIGQDHLNFPDMIDRQAIRAPPESCTPNDSMAAEGDSATRAVWLKLLSGIVYQLVPVSQAHSRSNRRLERRCVHGEVLEILQVD